MTATMHYDVIIIGTGAGGGTLAYRLAPSGKRILILERGDYVPRERANWDSRAVNVQGRYHTREVWQDKEGRPLHPHTNYYVGGNTKFYGAALFRLREPDFGELTHCGGVSPGWPISYAELEPYYTEAERLYSVHGERGVDPSEPFASAPYPFPAVSHEPRIQQLHDDLVRCGLKPFHVPLGVRLDESDRGRLKANQEATVRIEAIPGRDFKARINDISVLARVDFSSGWPPTKNFGLNLILVDGDAKIRPGMSAVARIAVERVPDVLLVPAESVFQRDGAPIVYRLDGPAFEETAIQIQRRGREQSIVASGLKSGDRIAQRRPPAELIRRTN